MVKSMGLKYEPASEPLHMNCKRLRAEVGGNALPAHAFAAHCQTRHMRHNALWARGWRPRWLSCTPAEGVDGGRSHRGSHSATAFARCCGHRPLAAPGRAAVGCPLAAHKVMTCRLATVGPARGGSS